VAQCLQRRRALTEKRTERALPPFSVSRSDLPLQPAPIHPDWIHDGNPEARNLVVSKSRDGAALTLLWDCTAGVFTWRYDCDETIHVLEGEALLWDGSKERRIGAGDVVCFPVGARVTWRVDRYIRKVAFFREVLPAPMILPMRAWWRGSAAIRALGAKLARTVSQRFDRAGPSPFTGPKADGAVAAL
jgi:uncharacterized cupin superfamily protein